jgi:titin
MALLAGFLSAGFAAGAPPALVAPGALFVTGGTNSASDQAISARLTALGYAVTSVLDSTTGGQDATGKAIVVISGSANYSLVQVKFKGVAVGVLDCLAASYPNMGMTGPSQTTDCGTSSNQTTLTVTAPTHPMGLGITDNAVVESSPQTFSWGIPVGQCTTVATNNGHTSIFCWDTGAQMTAGPPVLTAAARRTGFYLADGAAAAWNSTGQAFFDSAVRWTANCPPAPANVYLVPASAQVTFNWTASAGATSYNVKRATTSGGPYTTVGSSTTTSYTNTGLTNGTTYYYVVTGVNAGGEGWNSAELVVAPPGVPTGLAATPGDRQITLNWTAVPGATKYNVKQATASAGPYTTLNSTTATTYVDASVTNGTPYWYEVSALFPASGGTNEGGNSTIVSATPVGVPPIPTGVSATSGNAQALISWVPSAGATSYHVKRGTASGGPYGTSFSTSSTSYTDAGLTNGQLYFYVVSALNASGESNNSAEAPAAPVAPPAAPTGVTASAGNGAASLAWAPIAGATGYNVKRSTTSGGPYTTIATTTTASFSDSGLTNGQTYYYVVSALDAGGEGPNSSQTPLTPAPGSGALLIVGNTTLGAGDAAIQTRLQNLGLAVTVKLDSASATTDAAGKAIVVISSTVTSGNVAAKFASVVQPVLLWENGVMDDMGMTGLTSGTDYGTTASQTTLSIAAPWHPMAAGLTGTPAVSGSDAYTWGVPGPAAVKVATLATDSTKATIYCYNLGAPMPGLTAAPGRRAGFFLGDTTASTLNASGNSLFDAAARWCITLPPTAPTGLTRTASTGQVALSWTAVSGATGYVVKRATVSGGPYTNVGTGITAVNYNDTTVTNGTAYYYVVTALNTGGEGAPSSQVSATPVLAPTGLIASPGNGQATLTWVPVTGATGYNVKRGTAPGGPYGTTFSTTSTTYINTGLTNGTTYYYVVTATDTGGESANSSQVPVVPSAGLPAPTGVTATPGNTQVSLSWSAVTGAASYNVKQLSANGATYTVVANVPGTSYTATGLPNGTPVFYVISAVNGSEGQNSATVSATPFGAPVGLTASPGNASVALSWAPTAGVTTYNVKRGSSGTGPFTTVASGVIQTNYTNTGLTNGTTYYYVVSGVCGAVESANSGVVSAAPATVPGAPAGLTATAGSASVSLSWSAVSGATLYTVKRSTTSGSGYIPISPTMNSTTAQQLTTTTFVNLSVTNGTTYYYVVTAANAGGESANSNQAAATPIAAPSGLTAAAGNAQVQLAWSGAAGATSYNVKRSPSAGGPFTTIGSPATAAFTDSSVTNGTAYYYVVTGVNATGESYPSAVATATPLGPPSAPTSLAATAGSGKATFSWIWSGPGAVSFRLKRSPTSGGPYTTFATPTNAGAIVQGLANGTTFFAVVTAVTPSGESPNSNEISVTPNVPPPPNPTYMIGGAGRSTSSILWTFNDIQNTDHYLLHEDGTEVLKATFPVGQTWDVETGLQENASCLRHMHSVGEGGTSAASNVALGYSWVHDPFVTDFSLHVDSNSQITVTCLPVPNNPTGGVTGVFIQRSVDQVNWYGPRSFSNIYTFPDTGLQQGTKYYYRIQYRNGQGYGTAFSPIQFATTTGSAPVAPALTGLAHTTTSIVWSWNNVTSETGYELRDAATNIVVKSLSVDVQSWEETGLTENTQYTRYIRAINATGPSPNSANVSCYTLIRPPAGFTLTCPSPNQVKIDPGTLPGTGGGATWVQFQRWQSGYYWGALSYGLTPYTDSGLAPGTNYQYRIAYRNGDGLWTAFSPVQSIATPTGAPNSPSLSMASSGVNWILWQIGTVDGETSYELHDTNHLVVGTSSTDQLQIRETANISENTSYSRHVLSVQGTNKSGEPPVATVVTGWTQVHDPTAGDIQSISFPAPNQVTVALVPPPNGLMGASGCELDFSTDGGLSWPSIQYLTTSYGGTYTLPTWGGKLWFKFRYKNGAGTVTVYSPVQTYTLPSGVPPVPTGLTYNALSDTSIQWSWNNLLGETSFVVQDAGGAAKVTTGQDNLNGIEPGLTENNTYTRYVKAVNGSGPSAVSAAATGITLMHAPTAGDITLTQISPTQIDVGTTAPTSFPTTSYTGVQVYRSTDRTNWTNVGTWTNTYLVHDTGLTSGTQYFYRIQYRNQNGIGTVISPWKSLQGIPTATAVPATPTGFNGTANGLYSMLWTWTDVPTEDTYEVRDSTETMKAPAGQGIVSAAEPFSAVLANENLAVTRHVVAKNGAGYSGSSAAVTHYTLIHTPTTTDFSLNAISGNQIDISVTNPPNAGTPYTGVWVDRLNDGLNVSYQWWTTTTPILIHDTALQSGCTYSYRIRYVNGDNVMTPNSPIQSKATPAATPAVPQNLTATADSPSSMLWTWNNVWGEDGFVLHDPAFEGTSKGTTGADVTKFYDFNPALSENTAYTRHVHATSVANGNSAASTAYTRYTLIHTPTTGDITLSSPSATEIDVTIKQPPNPLAAYTACYIEYSIDKVSWNYIKYWNNTYTQAHTGLIPGMTYYYRVTFANGDNIQTMPSPYVSMTTGAAAPAVAPGNFVGTADTVSDIIWTWADIAGETNYVLHDANENPIFTLGYDILTYRETVTGSSPENTPLTRHVHAKDLQGLGPASNQVTRYTKIRQPAAGDMTVTQTSATSIHIVIIPPANNPTAGATGCFIDRSTDGVNFTGVKSWDTQYTWDDTNLQPNVPYYYRFWFRNADALQAPYPSPAQPVGTPPPAPPAAPASFTILWALPTSIRWVWPESPGATGYVIHDDNETVIKNLPGGTLEYTEPNLTENTVYKRHIHATNQYGPSPASMSFSQNTYIHDATTNDFTVAATSATIVTITVVPPPNPTVGATAAQVQRYDGGIWRTVPGTPNGYVYVDTGLQGGTTYLYRARYQEQGGWQPGMFSPSKPITTPAAAPPYAPNFRTTAQTSTTITWAWDNVAQATQYQLRDLAENVKGTVGTGVLTYAETVPAENAEYVRQLYFTAIEGPSAPTPPLSASSAVHTAGPGDFSVQPVSNTRVDVVVFAPAGGYDGQSGVEIQHSTDNATWSDLQAFSQNYGASDTTVTAGSTWYYRIQFRNRLGNVSGFSGSKKIVVGAPAAPGSFAGTGSTSSSITWTWADVTAESGFQLHDASHVLLGTPGPGILSWLEGSLAENIQFTRHVHAINGLGASAASTSASVYSLVHDPQPTEMKLRTVSPTEIDITVNSPPNLGQGQTGCEIQHSLDNGQSWTTIKPFSSGLTFADTGLTPVQSYWYRFRYQNGDGVKTNYSLVASTLTVSEPIITTPSKKVRTQTLAIAGTVVSGVGSVHVYFNGTDKGTATLNGTAWTFSSAGNAEGTYAVTARAFIGAASSDDSDVTTLKVDLTPPAVPGNIRTTAYSNAIDIEWDASTSPDVVGYRVYRKTGTTGTWGLLNTTGEVSGTKYRDSTAVNGTTYFYHVTAVDDALPN